MDIKSNKESETPQQLGGTGEKKNQSSLLVLLLILVGGFAYFYFFTDLIRPQEGQKTAAVSAPTPQPQTVKMPLPARRGEPAKPEEKVPAKAEAPAAKPASTPVAKAAPAAAPKVEQKKPVTAKPADKKTEPAPTVAKATTSPKTEEKKVAVADKKITPAKDGVKKVTSGAPLKHEAAAKTTTSASRLWSVTVGNYVLEEVLSADMGRVRKAGFDPIVKPSVRKKTTMNRLFVAEFNDRPTAQATLEKLKHHTSDAFILEQGGKFSVFAGSYLQSEAARSEKDRLKAAGYPTTLTHADIAIPSQSLSVGPFSSKKAAESALGKLKGAGIKATLSQK